MKQITKFNRLLSGVLSAVMAVSAVPIVSAHADESTKPYPYTLFAASSDEGAITVNAGNFCINGNIATNGTIISSGNMNVNGTRAENTDESMIFIFDKIDNQYFSTSNVDEHDEDYTLDELNININMPTTVQGKANLTGNININNALKALEDVKLYGEVKNTNDSVIFSKYGDIIIDSQNVNLNGLVYAPFGSVTINAQNLNLNNVVIIAESIVLTCPNVNANNSSNVSSFVGTESEDLNIPQTEWKYLDDLDGNGIPDIIDRDEHTLDNNECELYSDYQSFILGKDETTVTFYLETIAQSDDVVLYKNGEEVGRLYDDGNYSLHGDDIKGDGVYSLRYKITSIPTQTETFSYNAIIDGKYYSNTADIRIIVPLSDEERTSMETVNNAIKDILTNNPISDIIRDSYIYESSDTNGKNYKIEYYKSLYEPKINAILDLLKQFLEEGIIEDYYYNKDSNYISYKFTNGIPIIITTDDILDYGLSDKSILIDDGTGSAFPNYADYDILILNAFNDRDDYYNSLVKKLTNSNMSVTYDDNVRIESIKNKLKNHDIILFSGHGSDIGDITFNLLDHTATAVQDTMLYPDDLLNHRIYHLIDIDDGSEYYGITAAFIDYYFGSNDLDGSFVFSESCNFMGSVGTGTNYDFADAFINSSAEAVIGFENSVSALYCRYFMELYHINLLAGKTVQDSFEQAKKTYGSSDSEYKKISFPDYLIDMLFGKDSFEELEYAYPTLRGNGNAVISKKIKNGNFELGKISGTNIPIYWTGIGDARVVSTLGTLTPYGKKMGFISTGIGAKSAVDISGTQGSALSQTIFNNNLTTLSFVYDMISEEPMEYVGNKFDDTFEIQILDTSGNVIYSEIVESVNKSTWTYIPSIDFDGGDSTTYHTNWKYKSIDISKYQMQNIEIRFIVYDVGDSQYDSAVIIDNVICS